MFIPDDAHLRAGRFCTYARTDTFDGLTPSTLAPGSWTDIAKSIGGAVTLPVGTLSTVSDSGTGLRTVTVTESAAIVGKRFLRVKVTSP